MYSKMSTIIRKAAYNLWHRGGRALRIPVGPRMHERDISETLLNPSSQHSFCHCIGRTSTSMDVSAATSFSDMAGTKCCGLLREIASGEECAN